MADSSLERELKKTAGALGGDPPSLDAAADAAGLLDIAYATLDSPVGTLLLAATPAGLVRVAYLDGQGLEAVLEATAKIPYGAVSTYKQVAFEAGSPRGSRAAGNALGANPLPIVVPCHRVLHSSGGLGGYTGGLERKRLLLGVEGFDVGR